MRLVICIGNEARGDDGAAREVARRLEGARGMLVLSAPQLDVTMAEDVSRARLVTFVDAERRDLPPVRADAVAKAPLTAGATTHALDPPGLLALAEALYGRVPPAEVISIAAPCMGHGTSLSSIASVAVREAVAAILSGEPETDV